MSPEEIEELRREYAARGFRRYAVVAGGKARFRVYDVIALESKGEFESRFRARLKAQELNAIEYQERNNKEGK